MAPGPGSTVPAPTRLAPVLSLIGASRTLNGDTPRWDSGAVQFEPLPCGGGTLSIPGCTPVNRSDLSTPAGVGESTPFLLHVEDECRDRPADEADARVRQLLEIDQHYQLEREFWTGETVQGMDPAPPFRWLADPDHVDVLSPGDSSSPLRYALAALQEALGGCRPAGRGMIHATITTVSLWQAEGLLHREGGLLLDTFGNVVIPGVGYDGSGPDGLVDESGTTAWAYATGIVDTRLGEIVVQETFDSRVNARLWEASRMAAAYWDGCCHFGIRVNHCLTACSVPDDEVGS